MLLRHKELQNHHFLERKYSLVQNLDYGILQVAVINQTKQRNFTGDSFLIPRVRPNFHPGS